MVVIQWSSGGPLLLPTLVVVICTAGLAVVFERPTGGPVKYCGLYYGVPLYVYWRKPPQDHSQTTIGPI
jgi:hypothetical protein